MNKIITIILVVVIVGGAGVFLYKNKKDSSIIPTPITDTTNPSVDQKDPTAASNTQVSTTPKAPAVTFNNVVDANNQFASDLYLKYKSKEGNIFFSPYSIESALAMTLEGAKGTTAEEMQKVLHLPVDMQKIRTGFAGINTELNKKGVSYQLSIANALWTQKDYPVNKDYLSTVKKYYGGEATNLDFKNNNAEKSRVTINNWVAGKTNDKIKDLIPKGIIDVSTRLVLTNAIYFKSDWVNKFDGNITLDSKFTLPSNKEILVKTMHQKSIYNYGETRELQMLEMDYKGGDLSMLILLPKGNTITTFENAFTIDKLREWKKVMKNEKVQVSLPKFKFGTKYQMAQDLQEMGMPSAFKYPDADFSGINGNKELYIGEVIHQTFIEVAEYGTEAAAATAVIIAATSAMPQPEPQPKIFSADHPFMFIIQQKSTGNILFMGRISDPTK